MDRELSEDSFPFTAIVSADPSRGLVLRDDVNAVEMRVFQRWSVTNAEPEWDCPGVYLLLGPPAVDGIWSGYVGRSDSLRTRVARWAYDRDDWSRCLLVRRDTTYGFDATQINWLEAHIYEQLRASALADLWNKVQPCGGRVPPYSLRTLLACADGVMFALRLLEREPSAPDDSAPPMSPRTRRRSTASLRNLLDAGLLRAGETATSINSLWPATAQVSASGQIVFNGITYPTASAAAMAAKGGNTVNGWEFWAVQRGNQPVQLAQLRARYDAGRESLVGG